MKMRKLMITLPDGTRAGVVFPREPQNVPGESMGLEPAAPGERVPLLFYAPNRLVLDHIVARFGTVVR